MSVTFIYFFSFTTTRRILSKIGRNHLEAAFAFFISVLVLDAIFRSSDKLFSLNFRKYKASTVSPPISNLVFLLALHISLFLLNLAPSLKISVVFLVR